MCPSTCPLAQREVSLLDRTPSNALTDLSDSAWLLVHISAPTPAGNPGNVTMYRNKSPPLFYIHQNQLWHFHNDSTILPVNVHNTTGESAQLPLQLIADPTPGGVPGGRWRWQATMLFYENGAQDNQGLFYSCADVNGLNGMFLFLQWCVSSFRVLRARSPRGAPVWTGWSELLSAGTLTASTTPTNHSLIYFATLSTVLRHRLGARLSRCTASIATAWSESWRMMGPNVHTCICQVVPIFVTASLTRKANED